MQQGLNNNYLNTNNINWQIWWRLLRPHTLTAAFVPVLVGTALALHYTKLNILLLGAMLLASILIQSATNMFNEYYDFIRGLDNEESVGIGGTIVRDGISPKTILFLAMTFLFVSVLLGVYICVESSWWLAVVGIISMSIGYFYTGGPYPIAYTPFGEIFAGFFMGFVIIAIAFFIQTGIINMEGILISVPVSILCGAILTSNNIRDLENDKENGRRTLVILLGHKKAVYFLAGMFAVSYLWILGMVLFSSISPWLLIVFASLPKAIEAPKRFIGKGKPAEMAPAMKATAQLHKYFGLLMAIGLLISYLL